MFKTALKYGAILIGAYIGVEYYVGTSTDTKAAGQSSVGVIRALQGRGR